MKTMIRKKSISLLVSVGDCSDVRPRSVLQHHSSADHLQRGLQHEAQALLQELRFNPRLCLCRSVNSFIRERIAQCSVGCWCRNLTLSMHRNKPLWRRYQASEWASKWVSIAETLSETGSAEQANLNVQAEGMAQHSTRRFHSLSTHRGLLHNAFRISKTALSRTFVCQWVCYWIASAPVFFEKIIIEHT